MLAMCTQCERKIDGPIENIPTDKEGTVVCNPCQGKEYRLCIGDCGTEIVWEIDSPDDSAYYQECSLCLPF